MANENKKHIRNNYTINHETLKQEMRKLAKTTQTNGFQVPRQASLNSRNTVFDLRGVAAKFLPQRQRRGILRMGSTDLNNFCKCLGFVRNALVQQPQTRQQDTIDFHGRRNVHGRWKRIVATLTLVDL